MDFQICETRKRKFYQTFYWVKLWFPVKAKIQGLSIFRLLLAVGKIDRRAYETKRHERAVAVLRDDEAGHCQRISGDFIALCVSRWRTSLKSFGYEMKKRTERLSFL